MHQIAIFLILGIAADNIFVLYDGYQQTLYNKHIGPDKKRRLAFSFRRAARATATTSSTTAVAFYANAFNPIMPLASLGIYGGTLLTVVYVLIILCYPPLIIWVDINLRGKSMLSLFGKKDTEEEKVELTEEEVIQGSEPGKVE